MNKILFIVGPTTTGKTDLSLNLARKFNGEIISADSRQVYKGMDIGTGKDIPVKFRIQNSEFRIGGNIVSYYSDDKINIWGYDLVDPGQDFSVAQYTKLSWTIIGDVWQRGKLPIVVGGTGFYVKSLITPPLTMGVEIDRVLRNQLEKMSVDELCEKLKEVDPNRLARMNNSDRNNPRRLVRAIEVAASQETRSTFYKLSASKKQEARRVDALWVGLKMVKEEIDKRIDERVKKRLIQGFEDEYGRLAKMGLMIEGSQAGATLGYRQWWEYVNGKVSRKGAIENWARAEKQYARRQMTWFSKMDQIEWFSLSKDDFMGDIFGRVESWYSKRES